MIEELVSRVFSTRDAAHREHWKTKSYSQHMALGSFYEEVITAIDEIVECYQGHITMLKDIEVSLPKYDDFSDYLSNEADWIETNRDLIGKSSEHITNLIDGLTSIYTKTIYKLTKLK